MVIRSRNGTEDDRLLEARYIRKAAAFWEQNPGYGEFRNSVRYDVVIDGRHFPPKAIVAIARELAGFRLMRPSAFPGAKEGHWHQELKRCGFDVVPKGLIKTSEDEVGEDANLAEDLNELRARDYSTVTEKETLILARIGQGLYRERLLARWDRKCAVTGCDLLPAIRASHAMPWRWASDAQRLDPENGLPLVATLDALFDVGLISFDRDGQMLISSKLPADSTLLHGIPKKLRTPLTEPQNVYLRAHREAIFQYEIF
jgi:putative restriction endonuclease